jgi:hypothetical protein
MSQTAAGVENDKIVPGERHHLARGVLVVLAPRDGRSNGTTPASDPRHHAAQEPLAFAQVPERLDRIARHQAEVAGARREIPVHERAHDPVERRRGGDLEDGFAVAFRALGIRGVVAFAVLREYVDDDLRRILEIGVHDHDRVARHVIEAAVSAAG